MADSKELAAGMRAGFVGKEMPRFALCVMGVYGAVARGTSLEGVLSKYGLTREQYEANVERALSA